jgi:SAM-dependent methyltransferase
MSAAGAEESDRLRRLERVYAATTRRELDESYAQWACDYDRDVMAMGYMSPTVVAGMAARHVPPDCRVLDAGCGSGLLGFMLKALGYQNITGIDMNEAMLAIAAKRGAYAICRSMILGEHLDFPDASFGAAVAAGVFTEGHAPPHSFDDMIRVVAKNGCMVLGLRADGDVGERYRAACDEREGKLWRLLETSEAFQAFPLSPAEAHVSNVVRVYQRL